MTDYEYKEMFVRHTVADYANHQARLGWEMTHIFETGEKGHFHLLFRKPRVPDFVIVPDGPVRRRRFWDLRK